MASRVICSDEMVYDGIRYYRNEVFRLKDARNDDALVRGHYVKVITGDDADHVTVVDGATGREFWDERSMEAYRRAAPASDRIIKTVRPVGRPAGTKNSKPRQPAQVKVTPASDSN